MSRVVLRGRSAELATVLTAIRPVTRTGAGAMVVLSGEPGIGKTALLHAVLQQATRSGLVTGLGTAEEIDQIAPGAPLLLALRSGPRPLLDSTGFAGLASLYDRQLWLVERISDLLEEAAARTPVLIAIDDVHWADRLTRFALRILPGRLAASPVVWVLTSRLAPAGPVEELVAASEDLLPVTRVELGRLAAEDVGRLARDHLGTTPGEPVRELLRGAGGNPFWAVQVLDGLAWREAHGVPPENMHAELIDHVRRRLAPLSPAAGSLVRLAAVWGRGLPIADAARLLGDPPAAQVIHAAREAADHGLLSNGESGVEFGHTLVRDAVYADIAAADRAELHRSCARHLLAAGPSALAAVPHVRAIAVPGDEEAVEALLRAAADSAPTMPDQAAELAQEAFELMPPDHPRWLAVGRRAVALLVRVQREGAVLAITGRLIAATRDHDALARLQVQACRALWAIGDCHDIERRVGITLRLDGISATVRAQLSAVRALASTRTESSFSAVESAESALIAGRELGDELTQRTALRALAEAAKNAGHHQRVLDRLTDLRAVAGPGHVADEIRALQHLDRYAEADTLLAKIRHEAQDDTDRLLPSFLHAQIWQDHNLARLEAAEAGARTLLRLAWEIGNFGYEIDARMVLCGVAIYRGDLTEARATLLPAESREESRDELRVTRLRLTQGWLAAEEGDYGAALTILRPLVDAAAAGMHCWSYSPPWMRAFAGLGVAAGDRDFARATAVIAERGAERNPGVATMAGVALQVRGHVEADPVLLAEAVGLLRDAPRPLLYAQVLADHGTALRSAGDTAAADARTAESVARFESLGVLPGALAGVGVLQAARTSPSRRTARPARGPAALTETERRVADLVVDGHTSRSAAAELGVSPNTVNTHLRAVFAKLGVRSRVQLVRALPPA